MLIIVIVNLRNKLHFVFVKLIQIIGNYLYARYFLYKVIVMNVIIYTKRFNFPNLILMLVFYTHLLLYHSCE